MVLLVLSGVPVFVLLDTFRSFKKDNADLFSINCGDVK